MISQELDSKINIKGKSYIYSKNKLISNSKVWEIFK